MIYILVQMTLHVSQMVDDEQEVVHRHQVQQMGEERLQAEAPEEDRHDDEVPLADVQLKDEHCLR